MASVLPNQGPLFLVRAKCLDLERHNFRKRNRRNQEIIIDWKRTIDQHDENATKKKETEIKRRSFNFEAFNSATHFFCAFVCIFSWK